MRPIVLIPGLLGTPQSSYGPCAPWWRHPTVPFDLPGHGRDADGVPDRPTDVAIDRLCAVIGAQPEPPLLVSISNLGAAAAFRAAQKCGGRVSGVVLSGYAFMLSRTELVGWFEAFCRMSTAEPSHSHFTELHGDGWERILAAVGDDIANDRMRVPDRDDIKNADMPLLLLNGARIETERTAIQTAARCGADVAILAGAGHLAPPDSPRTFVAAVEEFSARIDEERTMFHERRRNRDRLAENTLAR